jgi:hypothetical protein
MNFELLFWIYLANAILLINHEIDSAYWQEWKLIKPNDKYGIKGFLIIHFPMLFAILYGLTLIDKGLWAGLIFSLLLSAGGIFAFFFHFHYLRKGQQEFNNWLSKTIITAAFILSIFQIALTITLL